MKEDIITISVVNFRAVWGQKEVNLNRIKGYVKAVGRQGSNMVVLPETALTGSDCQEMYTAAIDLSLATHNTFTNLFKYNPRVDSADWRPEIYVKMYNDVLKSETWKEKTNKQA